MTRIAVLVYTSIPSSLNPVEILEGEDVTSSIDVQSISGSLDVMAIPWCFYFNTRCTFHLRLVLNGSLVLSDTITAWNLGGGQLTAVASFLGCEATSAAVALQQPADLC